MKFNNTMDYRLSVLIVDTANRLIAKRRRPSVEALLDQRSVLGGNCALLTVRRQSAPPR